MGTDLTNIVKPRRNIDLVSPNIKRYIEDRQKYLICNPLYFLHFGSMAENKLEEEANRHSVGIELVNFSSSIPRYVKAKAQERKRCKKNIRAARCWAKANYNVPLTIEYIEQVGAKVDPTFNGRGYRMNPGRIKGSRVFPTSPEKVDRELMIFLWENEMIDNPLEKAIHAHFNLARIHPFEDGNGRTSRLIQDVILMDKRLPLAMIPLFERPEYIQKIEGASYSYNQKEAEFTPDLYVRLDKLRELASHYRELDAEDAQEAKNLSWELLSHRVTPEINAFYDFIALKVLNGLTDELKRLYPTDKEMIKYYKKRALMKEKYCETSRQNRASVYPIKNLDRLRT